MARPFSIRTKLTLAFVVAFAMAAGVGFFGVVQLSAVNGVTQEIREVWLPKLQSLAMIRPSQKTLSM